MSTYLKICLVIICIAAAVGWRSYHMSTTFVAYQPLGLDARRATHVMFSPIADFRKCLLLVLDNYHIKYKIDDWNYISIPLKVDRDTALVRELTQKADDIAWVYDHTKHPNASFLCKGAGYVAVVFQDSINVTCEDVQIAEQILQGANTKNQLSKYYRQYFGYLNEKGERCVDIDLYSKTDCDHFRFLKGRLIMEDGGDSFLHAGINLTRKHFEGIIPSSKG